MPTRSPQLAQLAEKVCTPRELEVLRLRDRGLSYRSVASRSGWR
jgi:hypothetical protein